VDRVTRSRTRACFPELGAPTVVRRRCVAVTALVTPWVFLCLGVFGDSVAILGRGAGYGKSLAGLVFGRLVLNDPDVTAEGRGALTSPKPSTKWVGGGEMRDSCLHGDGVCGGALLVALMM